MLLDDLDTRKLPIGEGDGGERKRRSARRIALLCVLCVGALVVLYVVRSAASGDARAFPACDSAAAIGMAKSGLADATVGQMMGLAIVQLSGITQVSSSNIERRCTAQATMNDRTLRTARYRIKKDPAGHYFAVVDIRAPIK